MRPDRLLELARNAAANAHAPYSDYAVGAALLCADGTVFLGCNVENASYGATNCAERTALFSAVASGHRDFVAMAVVADGDKVPLPCGICRQVMSEFCEEEFSVYVAAADALEKFEAASMGDLLPRRFRMAR